METGSRKLEAILGAIVLTIIGLFVWLSFAIGGGAPSGAVQYGLVFDSALGLTEDNAVAIAGVKVGVVDRIDIEGRRALVTIAIRPDVQLHDNAVAAVRAKTLLGEKYIDLDPGEKPGVPLSPGDVVRENTPTVEIDQLIRSAAQLVTSLNVITPPLEAATRRLDALLGDADGEQVAQELSRTLADTGMLIRETSALVSESKEDVRFLLKLSRDRGPEIIERIAQASERVDRLLAAVDSEAIETAAGRVGPTVEKVETVVTDLQLAMAEMRRASARLDTILVKVDRALTRSEDVNERSIREFLQVEGVRVNLIPDARVERRVRELRNEAAPLPVP